MTTTLEPVAAKRARSSRQRYYADGCTVVCEHKSLEVPGVTTVLNVLAKPALVPWANAIGLEGIKVSQYVDALAAVGHCAHAMIIDLTRGQERGRSEYQEQFGFDAVPLAENAVLKYLEWVKRHELITVIAETPIVSHDGFGGTPDWFGLLDDKPVIIDFKTSKGIYDEHFVQLAAYQALLREQGHTAEGGLILQIGRTETEGFTERVVSDLSKYEEIFRHALAIYKLQRELKK